MSAGSEFAMVLGEGGGGGGGQVSDSSQVYAMTKFVSATIFHPSPPKKENDIPPHACKLWRDGQESRLLP